MTTEEKAKAYDEAIKRANELLYVSDKESLQCKIIESILPELAESEDARIRKKLIALIKWSKSYAASGITSDEAKEMTAYLEKQCEHANFRNKIQIGDKVTRNRDGVLVNLSQLNRVAKKDEKQDVQNPADKVEPKFKVGDWVVYDKYDKNDIDKIVKFDNDKVSFESGDWLYINQLNEDCKLWTIQDTKDGDVLANKDASYIVVFKRFNYSEDDIDRFKSYFHCREGIFSSIENVGWCCNGFHPATKEQRDLLFLKMRESGYEWDAEKKELKKIEQKNEIDIPFGAKDSEFLGANYCIPEGFHAEIKGNRVFIKKGEHNSAWSEEDRKMFDYALDMVEWYDGTNKEKSRTVSDWLKSLKDRIQLKPKWNPSDEQMEYLLTIKTLSPSPLLESLYIDLKKLREE